MLPTNQSRQFDLQYDLQPGVVQIKPNEVVYILHIQKQPGLIDLPVTLQVTPPLNFILSGSPTGWKNAPDGRSWTWSGTLIQPLHFSLSFTKK